MLGNLCAAIHNKQRKINIVPESSVLIKGMLMPETCGECPILNGIGSGLCTGTIQDVRNNRRNELCPLVEVVHCKHCENFQTSWDLNGNADGHYCSIMDTVTEPNDFCSYGERKEEER